jgi:cytochrome c peroxidase
MKVLTIALLIAGGAFAHEGHGKAHAPEAAKKLVNPLAGTAEELRAGEARYGQSCAGCHGADGKANTPTARKLKVRPANLADYPMDTMRDGEIFWVVGHGIPPNMPALSKQPDDRAAWQVTLWVRELRRREVAAQRAKAGDFDWRLPPGFPFPNVPKDNPMTEAKVELGQRLFYDKRLSENQTQSCATCHQQAKAFTDGRARGVGSTGELHPRGPMSLVNVAYSPALTWANPNMRHLEAQALVPLFGEHPVEMGMSGKEDELLGRLRGEPRYVSWFEKAFPGDANPVTVDHVTKAIACFERTIVSGRSPYDRYRFQGESKAIPAAAKRGEALFFSERLECFHCHGGFNFTGTVDYLDKGFAEVEFHNTGLYNLRGETNYPAENTGVYEFTGEPGDVGKFKAPTLRNIALTAPYMHDGSIATLGEAIDHYKRGGRVVGDGPLAGDGSLNPNKSEFVRAFPLSAKEKFELIAFLMSLTDDELLSDPKLADPWEEGESDVLRGTVKSIDRKAGTLFVKHDPVGTMMPGMTMEFRIRNPEDLIGVKPGDEVEGHVDREGDDYFLVHLRVVPGSRTPKK